MVKQKLWSRTRYHLAEKSINTILLSKYCTNALNTVAKKIIGEEKSYGISQTWNTALKKTNSCFAKQFVIILGKVDEKLQGIYTIYSLE